MYRAGAHPRCCPPLPLDAARTGNGTFTPPATHDELVRELRYVDDDRLSILLDHSDHYDAEAIVAGVDLESDWLAGERAIADAARAVLAERARRGYRYDPGRMQVSRELLDEIRQRIDLTALVGQRIRLYRSGRAHNGDCPFHDSKSGRSFTVYPDGRYWCYGCHAHGDAIDWLMAVDGLRFREAVQRAAVLAGMAVRS